METLAISDGDLVIKGSNISKISGRSKLIQDLRLWLSEPIGTGFLTPNFGSTLRSTIGENNGDVARSLVKDEVVRVLTLYQTDQARRLREARKQGTLDQWSKDEILARILDVSVSQRVDRLSVEISIALLNDDVINFNLEI